ncbi:MAG: hypothetical protein VBE63_18830 [Lamprobacter sp.]|uniref:hypothetical protein n=1 Tax=Lamprobacter sp. TaxID=3100796 RepID=UPI002B25E0AD|nr:hypothetical protein [Lamprobacter sp.]MEA3641973.1 hypothetical protein [Lamprobacter sp.]
MKIERISSNHYNFSRVRVEPGVDSISVSGEVARFASHRGMIAGKVRIALIGAEGQLLEQAEVKPMRRNRQDRSAHFHARLAMPAAAVGMLRIEHEVF